MAQLFQEKLIFIVNHEQMNIRNLRTVAKISLRDLALQANVPLSELSKCERGLVIPKSDFFCAVAKILSVAPEALSETHKLLYGEATPGEGYTTAMPATQEFYSRSGLLNISKIPVVDLFCGVGGFSHGFEQTK